MKAFSKLIKLKKILQEMHSVLIAYSGGADSTFLLKAAVDALGKKVLAVTANSATYPKEELIFSKKTAKVLKARHRIIKTQELNSKRFTTNPVNRCYFCKKELFSRLNKIAKSNKINFVLDASSVSDKKDFRPGSLARKELGVRSPLEEAGFSKKDIRRLSRRIGLNTWNKPSLACLASRIPYGNSISVSLLRRIERAEKILRDAGFNQVRLRSYNGLCRIEVENSQIPNLIKKRGLVIEKLKGLGYNYITVDLEGYRTGSMNPAFVRKGWVNPKKVLI